MLVLKKKKKIKCFSRIRIPIVTLVPSAGKVEPSLFWVIFQKYKFLQFSLSLPCGGAADIMTEASTNDTKDILFNRWNYCTR